MEKVKIDQLVQDIQQYFIAQKLTLSLAESCTGGSLAARLTRMAGCSQYFLGSVVAYSNDFKIHFLGIDEQILTEHGAVSGPVVYHMAQRILQLSGSDYSLAVSGIAGPEGGMPGKPVGTIWGAVAKKGSIPYAWSFYLPGERQEIIEKSVEILLSQLWLLINNHT